MTLVEKEFIAAFRAADAVVTTAHTLFAVWRAVLAQLSGRACIGAGWTLHYAGTILIQKISCDTKLHISNAL